MLVDSLDDEEARSRCAGDDPVVLAQRMPPLNPILDTMGIFFDDKMVIINASFIGREANE